MLTLDAPLLESVRELTELSQDHVCWVQKQRLQEHCLWLDAASHRGGSGRGEKALGWWPGGGLSSLVRESQFSCVLMRFAKPERCAVLFGGSR